MIDPLRPYWPTNRSIAGLLVRGICLVVAAVAAAFASRSLALLIVLGATLAQATLLALDWMELKRLGRRGLVLAGIVLLLFLSLVIGLLIESRSVLGLTVR